jgi:hypothetical protein
MVRRCKGITVFPPDFAAGAMEQTQIIEGGGRQHETGSRRAAVTDIGQLSPGIVNCSGDDSRGQQGTAAWDVIAAVTVIKREVVLVGFPGCEGGAGLCRNAGNVKIGADRQCLAHATGHNSATGRIPIVDFQLDTPLPS